MIKKFENFKILESNQEKQHVILDESLLELYDDKLISKGNISIDIDESYKRRLFIEYNLNIKNTDMNSYKKLFIELDSAVNRSNTECKFLTDKVIFYLKINDKLQKFINKIDLVDSEFRLKTLLEGNNLEIDANYITLSYDLSRHSKCPIFKIKDDEYILFEGYFEDDTFSIDEELQSKQMEFIKNKFIDVIGAYDVVIDFGISLAGTKLKTFWIDFKMKVY
jgi:hypothetical protein